eukprot:12408520-Karenia_brevis.AAC.1
MKAPCEKDGVKTCYVTDNTPTGFCAVLIEDAEHSLCTILMATNNIKAGHMKELKNSKIVQQAKIIC